MTDQTPTNTDRMFEATLRARLAIAPGLGDVHATVNSGVATLTGSVQDKVDIKRAVLIAQAVEGLSEVREELQVAGASPVEGISSIPATRAVKEILFMSSTPHLQPDEQTTGKVLFRRNSDNFSALSFMVRARKMINL